VTTISVLKDARVHEIYYKAAEAISRHGLSNSLVYDPYTHKIDIMGGILLACGASERKLAEGLLETEECGVPPVNQGKVHVAYEYVAPALAKDPSEWCENHATHEAVALLQRLAERIEISIRIPESLTQKD